MLIAPDAVHGKSGRRAGCAWGCVFAGEEGAVGRRGEVESGKGEGERGEEKG